MNKLKRLKRISVFFINKNNHKKIDKIKDKEERLIVLQNSLISELKSKHLDIELKIKKLYDKKKKNLISLKSEVIHSKIRLLRVDFNEKDFKKIDSLLNKLEEEIKNV
jgi:hypothetical protein